MKRNLPDVSGGEPGAEKVPAVCDGASGLLQKIARQAMASLPHGPEYRKISSLSVKVSSARLELHRELS